MLYKAAKWFRAPVHHGELTFGEKVQRAACAVGASVALLSTPGMGDGFGAPTVEHLGNEPAASAAFSVPELDSGSNSAGPTPTPLQTPPKGIAARADQLYPSITRSPAFTKLTETQREQLSTILVEADTAYLAPFQKLIDNPGLMANRDYQGRTVLDDLYAIATNPVSPNLTTYRQGWLTLDTTLNRTNEPQTVRAAAISSITKNLVDPFSIGQQGNLCGPTAAEVGFATNLPGDYTLSIAQMISPAEQARLANGAKLKLHPEEFSSPNKKSSDPFDTLASRVFEPAAEDNANANASYDAQTDQSDYPFDWRTFSPARKGQGTTLTNEERLSENLFNTRYLASDAVDGSLNQNFAIQLFLPFISEGDRAQLPLDFLKSAAANAPDAPPIFLVIQTYNQKGEPDDTHFVQFKGEHAPVAVSGDASTQDRNSANADRIYEANPWGNGAAGSYTVESITKEFGPSYQAEVAPGESSSAEGGLMSLDANDAKASIISILAPRSVVAKYNPRLLDPSSLPTEIRTTAGELFGAFFAARELLLFGRRRKDAHDAKVQARSEKLVDKRPPLPNFGDLEISRPAAARPQQYETPERYQGTIRLRMPAKREPNGSADAVDATEEAS